VSDPSYCPFYCEENIWWLAADDRVGAGRRQVVVISNPERKVALWSQRAGLEAQQGLVVWDYHVVLACDEMLWDLDSALGVPVPLSGYLPATFRGAPPAFQPSFRVLDAEVYRETFASDRRHMRGEDGGFVRTPPRWPPLGDGHRLPDLLDFDRPGPGQVVDVEGLVRLLCSPR